MERALPDRAKASDHSRAFPGGCAWREESCLEMCDHGFCSLRAAGARFLEDRDPGQIRVRKVNRSDRGGHWRARFAPDKSRHGTRHPVASKPGIQMAEVVC